jgi:hypothetical protein
VGRHQSQRALFDDFVRDRHTLVMKQPVILSGHFQLRYAGSVRQKNKDVFRDGKLSGFTAPGWVHSGKKIGEQKHQDQK